MVISGRLINGIICQAGDSKNINLSGMTAIKRLSGSENCEKKRGKEGEQKGGRVETELAI